MRETGLVTTDPEHAASVLLSGGIIALPTETVYGLAAVALDEAAVHRVFDVKGRPRNHPLIVHLADSGSATAWGRLNDPALALAARFWPGPLTLLVPKTDLVPLSVTGGRDTVAIRIPAHPLAMDVLSRVGTGVVAPSANRFGKVSPTTADHVRRDLGTDVDLILDGGPCRIGVESTIVECTGNDVQILRPGAVTAAEVMLATGLRLHDAHGESRAPGMLLSHYAPDATVRLVESLDEALSARSAMEERGIRCSLLWYDDPDLYALHLYDDLRAADAEGVSVVIAVMPDPAGMGAAVRDRLKKAASAL